MTDDTMWSRAPTASGRLVRWLTIALLVGATAACKKEIKVEELPPVRFDELASAFPVETRPDLKVAFLGDHGVNSDAEAVLRLIKAEGVDLVLSQGDLGYSGGPDEFDKMITKILGRDFPFFASLGNHDAGEWRRYHQLLRERARRSGRATCEGILGVRAACVFEGLFFISSAVEVLPDQSGPEHAAFMAAKLAQSPARWRICSWHFNQAVMQVGEKTDQAGWDVYEACRKGGAIIATAHEHSYSRTHLLAKFAERPEILATGTELQIGPGQTIAFVAGLGGKSLRRQVRKGDWWAAIYTTNQGARPGALFCTFNSKGRKDRAACYFKSIDNQIPDRFELIAPEPAPGP